MDAAALASARLATTRIQTCDRLGIDIRRPILDTKANKETLLQ
jgi:hypothetical protein